MRRLLFVNRFFYPDQSATSQLLTDLAFHLVESGFSVEVVTGRHLYHDSSHVLPKEENVRGVCVHRLWTTRFGRGRLSLRAIDYLTFYVSALAKLMALADRDTVVVAETDPPLISVLAALVAWSRGAKFVNWVQDLFPEIAEALFVPGIRTLSPILRRFRNLSLKAADANVVLGKAMAARLAAQGVATGKIAVIHNWSLTETATATEPAGQHPLREEWGLNGKFVVGYSGNFGRAHDFASILEAASLLRNHDRVRFLFVGDGAQREWIDRRIHTLGLSNIVIKPYQPLERLHLSLTLPNVHLVSLKEELEGLVVPSKLYAVLAAGRGVLFIGSAHSEIAEQLAEASCGQSFKPGASAELAAAIAEFADDVTRTSDMGRNARSLWASEFRRRDAVSSWETLLARLASRDST